MSIIGSRVLGGAGQQPYLVGRSLRFRASASAYLNRTPASASNQKTWTWSGWIKRGALTSGGNFGLFGSGSNASLTNTSLDLNSDTLSFQYYTNTPDVNLVWKTSAVFRDPSAWYHVVLVLDTTQASSSNAVKIYVNGVQQTLTLTVYSGSYTQNQNYFVNSTNQHTIGQTYTGASYFYDGYLAEVNFIDGQALTPSSFGAYDNNGVWQPIKYGGTYGTNGFYLPFSDTTSTTTLCYDKSGNGNNWTPNNISLAAYVSFTTTGTTSWTAPSGVTSVNYLVVAGGGGGGADVSFGTQGAGGGGGGVLTGTLSVTPGSSYTVTVGAGGSGAGGGGGAGTQGGNSVFASITATGGGAGAGRGTGTGGTGGSGGGGTNGSAGGSGTSGQGNSGGAGDTGTYGGGGGGGGAGAAGGTINGGNGLSVTIGGLTATYGGGGGGRSGSSPYTQGTGGTGGGGNWSSSGTANTGGGGGGGGGGGAQPGGSGIVILSYTGAPSATTYDSMIDSPTLSASSSNYCVLNPLIQRWAVNAGVFSEGNLKITTTNASSSFGFGTTFVSTGKWYWEGTMVAIGTATPGFGVGDNQCQSGTFTNLIEYNRDGSRTGGAAWATYTTNDVISVAMDCDNSLIYFYKNNVLQGSISLTFGVSYAPIADVVLNAIWAVNFGQRPFTYTPPSGYNALNTYNLPQPTIMNGAKYMAATTYTGNGSSLAVANSANNTTGVVFQPDFVWVKWRGGTANHILVDSVRGVTKDLSSNLTNAETTVGDISALNSNGFTATYVTGETNANGLSYIGWQWNAGSGTTSTNTNGSISSLVSVNPTVGFSIVTYTGTGANATVGHGLGVAPNMVIVKTRSLSGENWNVWHTSLGGNTYRILLNTTAAVDTGSPTIWSSGGINPTSTTFTVGTNTGTNGSGSTYVAYCWSAVAGYSAFGSYTGNGSADGPFIYTGFRPRYLLIKRTDAANNWVIQDTSRDTYNVSEKDLYADTSGAEATYAAEKTDILSNGFKQRGTGVSMNASGGTYIYAAFAENPFKISRAR